MSEKDDENHGQLSLFGDLIGNAEAKAEDSESASVESIIESDETATVDPIGMALKNKDWDSLALLTESGINSLDKLLWVIAQKKLKIMPSAVLCAPLEEALGKVRSTELQPEIKQLAAQVTTEIAENLLESDERELALSLLTVASKCLDGAQIREKLVSLLAEDVASAPSKESLLSPSEMQKRLQLLDLKRSLVARDSGAFELGISNENQDVQNSNHVTSRDRPLGSVPGWSSRNLLLLGLGIVGVVVIFLIKFVLPKSDAGQASARVQLADGLKYEVKLPEVSPIPPPSRLDSIMYDNRLVPTALSSAATDTDNAVTSPVPTIASESTPTVSAPDKGIEGKVVKQPLKIDGPFETNKIEKLLGDKSFAGSRYDDILPDERDFLRKPIEEKGRDRPRREVGPDETRSYSDDRADSREPIKEGDNLYEVRINTTVMDRPSFKGRTVADLYVGDRVLVEARVGKWFRIRSQKGAPGYVMGQDVEKID